MILAWACPFNEKHQSAYTSLHNTETALHHAHLLIEFEMPCKMKTVTETHLNAYV